MNRLRKMEKRVPPFGDFPQQIRLSSLLLIVVTVLSMTESGAQNSGLYVPLNVQKAYNDKTRSWDGKPGVNYWQNRADYSIDVAFNPNTRILYGKETITYFNDSPDTLKELILHLYANLYKKGNARDFNIEFDDESDGVIIEEFVLDHKKVDTSPQSEAIEYDHTILRLNLPQFLLPAQQVAMNISWHYQVNKKSHMRTGAVDSSSFFIAYFFPRIAVYDDIDGWNDFKYTGTDEFYNDFGDYEVSITVPKNFIVWATGTLMNPEKVLLEKYLKRYLAAFSSDDIVSIIDSTECTQSNFTKPDAKLIWKFKASHVSDFAFAISDHYLWDASSLIVDKKSGRRVLIDASYNKDSKDFYQVAKIARQAIDYMSSNIPGVPYPFVKETVFNGGDEMEYPMMVNDISNENIDETIKLTSHEILHSYLPFYMGINETRYAWMDEGFTSFGDYLICSTVFSIENAGFYSMKDYKDRAGRVLDIPIFGDSQFIKKPVYRYNSYAKPAAFFLILKDLLGEKIFKKALLEFIDRWNGKHPTPFDLFFTFNHSSGQNLDWLIKPWFFEYGYVDLAIQNVSLQADQYSIVIERKGHYPAPIKLKITYADSGCEFINEKASVWKNGNVICTIKTTATKKIERAELCDQLILDVDSSNDSYIINKNIVPEKIY